ncbi:MAG: hypothetical protein IT162_04385 [Bryobacterales bacterium]|nr:hypothetical protein [Bryobacterales bacterium]
MSQQGKDAMQDWRGRVGTQRESWNGFRIKAVKCYLAAYKKHRATVEEVNAKLQMDHERAWAAMSLMWTMASALMPMLVPARFVAWGARLVPPIDDVKTVGESIAKSMAANCWERLGDQAKSAAEGSPLETIALWSGNDPDATKLEPSGQDPYEYDLTMQETQSALALGVMRMADAMVSFAGAWEQKTAELVAAGIESTHPYWTDLPNYEGTGFEKGLTRTAELNLWIQWAMANYETQSAREKTNEVNAGNRALAFEAVLDRLYALQVPLNEVTRRDRVGGTFMNRSRRVLDWSQFYYWASRTMPRRSMTKKEVDAAMELLKPKFKTSEQCRLAGR